MISRTHAVARRLRLLRDDAALRESEGVFVAEGVHLAQDALAAAAAIELGVVSPRLSESDEGRDLLARLQASGIRVETTSDAVLDGLQDARSPQPVVLIVKRARVGLDAVIAGRGGGQLAVIACGVQEPGNLGALWRTADAAGATGFVAAAGSASLTHPRTVRASMGAIFRLTATEAGIGEIIRDVKSRGLRVVGADARDAVAYDAFDWSGPIALLVGREGAGLPHEAVGQLDARVGIPMAAGVESLSVNAAAAVLLFEAARKRRQVISAG